MIIHENNTFLLKTQHYSCLLWVNDYGLLEQLHFGAPIDIQDADALKRRAGLGWGASVLLNDKDSASGPDSMGLAWSGSGRGDYRESPLEIGKATDLRYVGHTIHEGIVPMTSGLPQAQDASETLEIVLEQPGLRLRLIFTVFETVMTRRCVLENTGDASVTVQKIMSYMLDLPDNFEMTTFDGGWIAEMRKHTVPILDSRVVNESVTGSSSNRHNPGFLLNEIGASEDHGKVYGFNLVYSGNHYAAAQRSLQGFTGDAGHQPQ